MSLDDLLWSMLEKEDKKSAGDTQASKGAFEAPQEGSSPSSPANLEEPEVIGICDETCAYCNCNQPGHVEAIERIEELFGAESNHRKYCPQFPDE